MRFEFGFYSSLLLIFFVHGLVYALMLFARGIRNDTGADKWLSLFLLLCILYIAPWMLGFAGWYDNQPYRDFLFYTPFQHLFLIGPVLFFYVQSLLNPSFRFRREECLQLLPALCYLLFCGVMFITDKLVLKKYFFLHDGSDRDFDAWYQLLGFVSMLGYFLLSLRYYNIYKRLMRQVVSYADAVLFRWVRNFLYAFLVMLIMRLLFYGASFVPAFDKMSYMGSWWQYFSFAVVFYYIAISGYANAVHTKVPFKLNIVGFRPPMLLEPAPGRVEQFSAAATIEIDQSVIAGEEDVAFIDLWRARIENLVIGQKAFVDPELSLSQLAKDLKTNPSVISKAINQGFHANFNDYINMHRVEAVKEKLLAGDHRLQTLLGIAFDCGFNSKATFNRAFKKATGISPKEWLIQHTTN